MEIDINDFVTFEKLKNGVIKLKHDNSNLLNIAKYLHKIGYGTTKVNSKTVYFKRENSDIIPVHFDQIKRAFYKVIKNYEYINLPEYVTPHDVSDWYLTKHPIKKNEMFNLHLKDNLNDEETHKFLIKANHIYNEEFKIQKLLLKLSEFGFKEIINHQSNFFVKGNILYKNINDFKYLIFIKYMNNHLKRLQFECYLAEYNNEKDIELKSPSRCKEISCCFDIEKDYPEINQYLN